MASANLLHPPPLSPSPSSRATSPWPLTIPALKLSSKPRIAVRAASRRLRPVEERFRIIVEKSISPQRVQELGIPRWPRWECGKCKYDWEWKVDELVYIVKGCVQVTPEGCQDSAWFYAGDLVRFPKWLNASLSFENNYVQHYSFRAYGDD